MDSGDISQQTVAAGSYVTATPAVWAIQGGQFWGTLGLTAAGRLEFTLKDDKLIFSAPLASVKYRFLTSQVILPIVVGSRTYKIQFYRYYLPGLVNLPSVNRYIAARQGSPNIRAWKRALAEFTPPPPDTNPLIAAHLPGYLVPSAQLGRQGVGFFVCYSIIMGIAILLVSGLSQTQVRVPRAFDLMLAVGVAVWIIGGNIWLMRRYKKLTTTALPTPSSEDLATSPEDVLPPGTPPLGSLGISTAGAYLLGLLLAGAIFGLPYLVIYLASN
ncbi:MAG TPA: hypothetical protein VLF69_00460 [Candidatus Saccharimonadales bacterium]|nr:hypothetical protein [Candidatus Saccharimonadales bacterium]